MHVCMYTRMRVHVCIYIYDCVCLCIYVCVHTLIADTTKFAGEKNESQKLGAVSVNIHRLHVCE